MHDVLMNSVVAAALVEIHRSARLGLICKVVENIVIYGKENKKFFSG